MWLRQSRWWGHVSSRGHPYLLMMGDFFKATNHSKTQAWDTSPWVPLNRHLSISITALLLSGLSFVRSRRLRWLKPFHLPSPSSSSFNHECDWCSHEADWGFNSCQLPARTRYPFQPAWADGYHFPVVKIKLIQTRGPGRIAFNILFDWFGLRWKWGQIFRPAVMLQEFCENH